MNALELLRRGLRRLRAWRAPRTRGYALAFVLLLMVALGIVVGGLMAVLSDSVSNSKAAHEDLQQMYGCDGALRLANVEAQRHAGDRDISGLRASLNTLAAALRSDINPRTGRPFADLSDIRVVPLATAVLTATDMPFLGMEYVQEGSLITVASDNTGGRGRACSGEAPNRRRTLSYFQFAVASTDTVTAATSVQTTGGTSGDVFVLLHQQPGGRRQTTARGADNVQIVNLGDRDVFRPDPPSGQPWRFVNKKKKLGGLLGNKRRNKARRPTLEAFLKFPTDTPEPDPTASRFVKGADVRIIDGDWFTGDTVAFPGSLVWSDRPGAPAVTAPRAFSAYERDSGGRALGGAAVVRYGLVNTDIGAPMVKGFCAGDLDLYVPVIGTPPTPDCGAAGPVSPPTSGETDPIRAAAMTGFIDPSNDTPILPIVVDAATLRAAMVAPAPGDLGTFRCVGSSPAICPSGRRFGGSIWIGTREGGELPDGTPGVPCPLAAPGSTSCVRPNAVVLYNLEELSPFLVTGEHGLSIASNLPIYVVGDVNVTSPGSEDSRIALLAPQITALAPDFNMSEAPWGGSGSIPSKSAALRWNTSLFTSWASLDSTQRAPARHVVRQIEDGVRVDVVGSVVTMFARDHYPATIVFERRKGSYRSGPPDPQVAGLPIFLSSSDPLEATGSRLASGSVRFPGDNTRDLRRTEFEKQPPNAPRLSIDLAPLDKR